MILTLKSNVPSVCRAFTVRFPVQCAIALLLICGDLVALDPAHDISQYGHTAWTRQNGGPQAGVFALAQTLDGDLWLGTELGLFHFDGARFLPWQPPHGPQLTSEYILALAASRDGSLWIGTRQGLSHWNDNRVENYQTSKGPTGPVVVSILLDRAGTVWAGTVGYHSGGLCRVERDSLRCYETNGGLPGPGIFSLREDRLGRLWAGGASGLSRIEPADLGRHPLRGPAGRIISIAEDKTGQIWIADGAEDGLKRLQDGTLVPYPMPSVEPKIRPTVLLSDRNDGLWIGTAGQGLLHLHQGKLDRFGRADGLSGDHIRCLIEDREGNVWAATEAGLDRFRDLPVTTISKRQGLPQNGVVSVFASRNAGMWIGALGGLNRVEGGRITAYNRRHGLPDEEIRSIFEQASGRVWVDSTAGLAYSERGRFHVLNDSAGRKIHMMTAAEDSQHSVWLSDLEQGLLRIQETRVAEVMPWSQFENKRAWAMEADPKNGGLWLGFSDGGIAWYKPGHRVLWYTHVEGLAAGAVMDLHLARDGTLWIATESGLSQLRNGHIASITTANGLPCDRIHAMVEDDNGALWLDTACGLLGLSRSDLAAWAAQPQSKLSVATYDVGDGMRTRSSPFGYFRRAARSGDGRLWFAVFEGVAVVDPSRLPQNHLPPPVKIEGITADHTAFPVGSNVKVPPLTRDLQIDYTAFSFVAPEKVRFRYKLEGFDLDWKDVGGRRQALYTNLPPGPYQFHVVACNNDGLWNTSGASFGFRIQPAFYQTLWFRVSCIASIAVMLWMLYRLRVRQVAARLRVRYEARLGERARISRELHDNLLQNITGFALQLEGLGKTVTAPESAKDRLHDLRRQAEQWMHEAREAVWDLRSAPALEDHDLPDALREAGQETTKGKDVQFHLTVAGKRHAAPSKVREQLLRIVQEATRNAIRHGQAKEINTHVAYMDAGRIRVTVSDDGCGFNLEEASRKMGHCGLATMQERAQQIGAKLKISTRPGQGTEIEIVAPISPQPQ